MPESSATRTDRSVASTADGLVATRSGAAAAQGLPRLAWPRPSLRALRLAPPRPELALLAAVAALLNLWGLSRNGWANEYYSAAVRSMSTSWHNFLFGSLDAHGLMTVDKPPLALWVQALSVRLFGFHPLSMLVPQALMGVASTVLVYDLVRRRFGRGAGLAAGLALATTPITVAVSRHNNPDALLVLCCVAALWFSVRALEDGRTRWLVLAGLCVGLGFEAKMGVALMVVPGIVAAWLWVAPRGRVIALRQLAAGGGAMVVVGGAWPLMVALTPAADRPWVSGTSDNSILSLILNYNGFGRLDGQAGGPGGGGGSMFGGTPGPLRLLNSALGGQGGWLLGFAAVAAVAILIGTRARRADPRTGWIIAVGGAFLTTAVAFSAAHGIFHPYYVALLAPFAAALAGAGVGTLRRGERTQRILGPLAVLAGVATEIIVLRAYPGQLAWIAPVLLIAGGFCAVALTVLTHERRRDAALVVTLTALLLAPGIWAVDTLGHRASGTFPAGGPPEVSQDGPGGFGGAPGAGRAGAPRLAAGGAFPGPPPAGAGTPAPGGAPLFGPTARRASATGGGPPSGFPRAAGGPPGGFPGGPFGGQGSLTQVLDYTRAHGGGTVGVASQSSAASAIIGQHADVAGIGGFSGRESQVTVAWLAQAVRAGRVRWIVSDATGRGSGPALPGDTRAGAATAVSAAAAACRKVTLTGSASSQDMVLYDCRGRADALRAAAVRA